MKKNEVELPLLKKIYAFIILNIIVFAFIDYVREFLLENEILTTMIPINEEKNIILNLVIIGFFSGFVGAIGHFIGKVIEFLISDEDSFKKRFFNDFFRVLFWVTTTIYLYLSLMYLSIYTVAFMLKLSILIGLITATICGISYPILNKKIFGSYIASGQKNMMQKSLIWFLLAGFIWGFIISILWDIFILDKISFLSDVYIGIITAIYGVINGLFLQLVGGLGHEDSKKNNNYLISFNLGFIISVPIAIIIHILYGELLLSISIIYIGGIIGLMLSTDLFMNAKFIDKIRIGLVEQQGGEGSAKVMVLLVVLLFNAPWSAFLCYGFILFK